MVLREIGLVVMFSLFPQSYDVDSNIQISESHVQQRREMKGIQLPKTKRDYRKVWKVRDLPKYIPGIDKLERLPRPIWNIERIC